MNKQKKYLLGIGLATAFIIVLAIILSFSGFLQSLTYTFDDGFKPYGESPNQITELILLRDEGGVKEYSSKYWDISMFSFDQSGSVDEASDFNLITNLECKTNGYSRFVTNEDFSERTFKTIVKATSNYNIQESFKIILINGNTEILIYEKGSNGDDTNVRIEPSPIDNSVYLYINGIKVKTINIEGSYKIGIYFKHVSSGCRRGSVSLGLSLTSYKEQFGCTKQPNEQYYVRFFNENEVVSLDKLNNFNKFCLSELPLSILTNAGSTTTQTALVELVNGISYTVPPGQIWAVSYIGNLTNPETECESSKIFNVNSNECMAKTAITIQCPVDSIFNTTTYSCTVETEPAPYTTTSIETHQELQKNSQFRFTDIFRNYVQSTANSFSLLGNTFQSEGVSYLGKTSAINQNTDSSNWIAQLVFNGQNYQLHKGEYSQLNQYVKVQLTDLQGYYSSKNLISIKAYKAEYTFDLDTSFISTKLIDNKIIVSNSLIALDGGIVLETEDILGQTKVEAISKTLELGDTEFALSNASNIRSIKVRPFIKIATPDYTYTLDVKKALTINDRIPGETGTGTIEELKESAKSNAILIVIIVIIVIFIIVGIIAIIKRRK